MRVTRATGLEDTPDHRRIAENLAQLVAACLRSGRTSAEVDAVLAPSIPSSASPAGTSPAPPAPTLRSYYGTWIAEQAPRVRPALLREYTRHFAAYILPTLGDLPLTALRPKDVRARPAS